MYCVCCFQLNVSRCKCVWYRFHFMYRHSQVTMHVSVLVCYKKWLHHFAKSFRNLKRYMLIWHHIWKKYIYIICWVESILIHFNLLWISQPSKMVDNVCWQSFHDTPDESGGYWLCFWKPFHFGFIPTEHLYSEWWLELIINTWHLSGLCKVFYTHTGIFHIVDVTIS